MPIIWAVLWGLIIPAIMWVSIQYWLPKLAEPPAEAAEFDRTETVEPNPGQYMPRIRLLRDKHWKLVFFAACGLFSAWCGYTAAMYANSFVDFSRIWLTFAVLACVMVTDMELFLIPNKCSVILLLGGVVLLAVLWIAEGVFPVATALESVVSAVACLITLLILSLIARGGLGMGDVKILSSIAFLCGIGAVCGVLMIAMFLSALSSALLLLMKKKHLKDLLPLGPFLWVAMGISVLLRLM